MSADKPHPTTDPRASVAQFPVVLRGYDRELVDLRVAELVARLQQERQYRREVEQALRQLQLDVEANRGQLPGWFASAGDEVNQVLEQAGAAAKQLLTEAGKRVQVTIETAHGQAAERIKTAEDQANQLEQAAEATLAHAQRERVRLEAEAIQAADQARAQADRDAKALLSKAQDEAELAWLKASRERMLLQAEAERLAALRQTMVDRLQRVYAPLGLTLVDTRHALEAEERQAGQVEIDQSAPLLTATDGKAKDGDAEELPGPGNNSSP